MSFEEMYIQKMETRFEAQIANLERKLGKLQDKFDELEGTVNFIEENFATETQLMGAIGKICKPAQKDEWWEDIPCFPPLGDEK